MRECRSTVRSRCPFSGGGGLAPFDSHGLDEKDSLVSRILATQPLMVSANQPKNRSEIVDDPKKLSQSTKRPPFPNI